MPLEDTNRASVCGLVSDALPVKDSAVSSTSPAPVFVKKVPEVLVTVTAKYWIVTVPVVEVVNPTLLDEMNVW